MARAPFSVFTRVDTSGKTYFCVRFFDSDGKVKKTITVKEAKNATAAARIAEEKLREGIIPNALNPDVLEYLTDFWKRDSDYVAGRALRGVTISDKYLYENQRIIEKYLKKRLKGKKLLDITPSVAETIMLSLAKEGVKGRRVNGIMQCLRVPYAHFCRLHKLAYPLSVIEKAAEKSRERGILTADEISKIIALKGESPRIIAAVLLGALCGLRLGEVRGLQLDDIDEPLGVIHVRHNYISKAEGLKAPKWDSVRDVALPAPVADALRLVAAIAPEGAVFALFNEHDKSRPVPEKTLQHGFERIMAKIGIAEAERKSRHLVFHGLRHTFVSLSRAGGVPDFIVQRMVGHRSMKMTDNYSHAEGVVDFAAARSAMEKAVAAKEGKGKAGKA